MDTPRCINGTLDTSKYSKPMPVVGLYIAVASLVCMLLIIHDVVAGFRARQRWLPCKWFTLNSVTLSLLAIASKIPVDLTAPMPRPQDQLSKLCGTSFICISMAFLLPSLGTSSQSESLTNMVAMTILVVTIAVNICIQLSTGVIVLFKHDHIIVLVCMLLLLMISWFSFCLINNSKKISIDQNRKIFTKGMGSLFQRLKTSYSFGYCSNPQLELCRRQMSAIGGLISPICLGIVVYAAYRSLTILKPFDSCLGSSDYRWSVSLVIAIQILTVVIGSSAVIYRWLTLSKYVKFLDFVDREAYMAIGKNPVLGVVSRLDECGKVLRNLYLDTVVYMQFMLDIFPVTIIILFWTFYDDGFDWGAEEWVERKSKEDMERCMDASRRKPASQLFQLIARTDPSSQLRNMELEDQDYPSQRGVKVCSLSVVLLVRIAQVALPDNLCEALVQSFSEGQEIINFIDETISPKSLKNDNKLLLAKAVWAGNDFSCLLPKIFNASPDGRALTGVNRAAFIITSLKKILPADVVWKELGIIVDFINRKTYSSIDDLYASIEQMFIDMFHLLLSQFPNAIFKILSDSPAEEYEERVKLALHLFCKIEPIESHIQWWCPAEWNISRLITTEASDAQSQNYRPWADDSDVGSDNQYHPREDVSDNGGHATNDRV